MEFWCGPFLSCSVDSDFLDMDRTCVWLEIGQAETQSSLSTLSSTSTRCPAGSHATRLPGRGQCVLPSEAPSLSQYVQPCQTSSLDPTSCRQEALPAALHTRCCLPLEEACAQLNRRPPLAGEGRGSPPPSQCAEGAPHSVSHRGFKTVKSVLECFLDGFFLSWSNR